MSHKVYKAKVSIELETIFVGSEENGSIEDQAIHALGEEAFYSGKREFKKALESLTGDFDIEVEELKSPEDLIKMKEPCWGDAIPQGPDELAEGNGITVKELLEDPILLRKLDYKKWLE